MKHLDIYKFSLQGTRAHMEDRLCLIENFAGHKNWIFGGVFDGHGGKEVAELAVRELSTIFAKNLEKGMPIEDVFKKSYQEMQEMTEEKGFQLVGCTALTFFIKDKDIFIANAGDTRMIMVSQDKVEQITRDHRTFDPEECERISKSGGIINGVYVYKDNYGVMPTRTLGDSFFKDVGVIAEPEVFSRKIPDTPDTFFIMATDGLWDAMSNEELAEIFMDNKSAQEAGDEILRLMTSHFMSLDNIVAIIIKA